jgi:purine-binding chemotaxis protein CheW
MPEAAAVSEDGATRRYLTFRLDAELYALPAEEVAEVIRTPAVARIPQGPKSLLGLANLRGEVLPVASLRGLLGRPQAEALDPDSRAIVLDLGARVALTVDGVEAMVNVPAERLQTRQAELAALPGERLRGAFQAERGGAVAKVLDLKSLLDDAFVQRERPAREARALAPLGAEAQADARMADGEKIVTFEVADQEFGLPLAAVREIISTPDTLAVVPRAEAAVLGVMSYRDSLLPLLSLRGLLGFPAALGDGRSKVLVTIVGGVLVGLVADRMRAIVTADPAAVEPTPPMLAARTGGESRIQAIYRGEGGRRLISILAADQLFREDVMQRLGEARPSDGQAAAAAATEGESLQVLVFRLGADEFALPIGAVDEVARAPEQITRVPKTPAFLEGVINLRGEVLPVVDQRRRFDMPPAPAGEAQRLIVVRSERHRAGLLVDAVSEVLTAPLEAMGAAPDLTGDAGRLVQGVVNLHGDGRMVLLLDPAELLTRAERGLLDAFAAEDAPASS